MLGAVTGAAPAEIHIVGGGARNALLCRWTAERRRAAGARRPGRGDAARQPARAGDRARRARLARRGARGRPRVVRAGRLRAARRRVRWQEARSTGSRVDGRHGGDGHDGEPTSVLHGIAAPEDRWERGARGGARRRSTRSSTARTCSAPTARSRTSAAATRPRRARSSTTPAARCACSGSRARAPTSRRSRPRASPALRLDEVLPLREREEMDDAAMVDYLVRCAVLARPAAAVDRDAAARVRPRAAGRPHPSRRGDRAHLVARRARGSPRRRSATRPSGSTTSGPGSTCRGGSPSCSRRTRARGPCCSRSTGSSPGARRGEESYRATIEFVTRAARGDRRRGERRLRARRPEGRRDRRRRAPSACCSPALPALRGALLADADGVVLEVDRSPEAVAFASAARTPEVSQVGAPCPDHLINTKHKPLVVDFDPSRDDGADELARRVPDAASSSTRDWYRDYYERNLDDESRPFPIDPAGPRVVLVPGRRHRHERPRRGQGARRARPLPPRDRGRGRGRRDRRLPLAERGGGVRDRVLAARALQARAGAAAAASCAGRIALITGGASGIGRATARLLADRGAHVVVADLNADGAQPRSPTRSSPRTARAARSPSPSTSPTRPRSRTMPRRTVLAYGGLDILVASAGLATSAPITETTLERLGAELRRARPRLLPRGARGVPRAARAGPRRLGRLRRLEERARRGRERGRVLVGEGRLAPPRHAASPRRAARTASASTPSTRTR